MPDRKEDSNKLNDTPSSPEDGEIKCNMVEMQLDIGTEKGVIVVDLMEDGSITDGNKIEDITDTDNDEVITDRKDFSIDEEKCLEVIPSYDITSESILTDRCDLPIEEKKPSFSSCWNCEGGHNLTDCKEPRNHVAIARNRKKFLKAKPAPNVRYHEDTDQKYAGVKPGAVSDKLKKALGLQDWQAPEFIYRMRVLGYPPGWMKEAEVHRAEVSIIDGDGSAMSHPEDEEGEVDRPAFKYDPDKLISYPGFNVPFNDRIEEEANYYGCPAMQYCHSRSEFERIMKANRAAKYKRKKLEHSLQSKRVKTGHTEMEISEMDTSSDTIEYFPPLPKEDRIEYLPPLPKQDNSKDITIDDNTNGKRAMILNSDYDNTNTSMSDCDKSGHTKSNGATIADNTMDISSADLAATPAETSDSSLAPSTPTGTGKSFQHKSLSKSFNYGVGIPGSLTPCHTPPAEKWSVGISGHIDFDSIPDSTGKWDKINKIMGRVRLQMNSLNEDDK